MFTQMRNPRMIMIVCIFLLLMVTASFPLQVKAEETLDFLRSFTCSNEPKLHICIDSLIQKEPQDKRLDRTALLARFAEVETKNLFESDIFASLYFFIDGRFDGYLVEEWICGHDKHIYLLVYDKGTGYFTQMVEVAFLYGYEGSSGEKESYIYDLNDDGLRDIITMEFTESFIPKEENGELTCEYVPHTENLVFLFRDGRYQKYEGFNTLNY